jgi:DNA-binding protein HU-beta
MSKSEEAQKTSMSTDDIVKAVSSKEGMSQKDVRACLKAIEEAVAEAVGEGKKVQLTGFATIAPIYRAERMANNIVTGEPMKVPETMSVSIKAGSMLKTAVDKLDPKDYAPGAEVKEAKEAKPAKKSKAKK